MTVLPFPLVTELGDRLSLAFGDEDGVVAEALFPALLLGNPARERAGAAELLELRGEEDELADVACAATVGSTRRQLIEQPPYVLLVRRARAREPCGADPGASAEAFDLEPRVLAEDPELLPSDRPAEAGLRQRVLVESLSRLGRLLRGFERLDLPVRQERTELAELVLVP